MSSTNKTANYELSQFVGTDIPSILNDYNGDMRKIDTAIKAVATAEGGSQSDIAGLQATVGQHTTEISGINSTVNALSGRVVGIEEKIPANASERNKLITIEDIPEIPDITELEEAVNDLGETVKDVDLTVQTINTKIPSSASASNKLATMADIVGNKYVGTVAGEAGETFGAFCARLVAFLHDNIQSVDLNALTIFLENPFTRESVMLNCVQRTIGSVYKYVFSNNVDSVDCLTLSATNDNNCELTYRTLAFDNVYNMTETNRQYGTVTGYTVSATADNITGTDISATIYV